MSFLDAVKLYILALLKISYEISIGLMCIVFLMVIIRFLKGDKYFFTKILIKVRRSIIND